MKRIVTSKSRPLCRPIGTLLLGIAALWALPTSARAQLCVTQLGNNAVGLYNAKTGAAIDANAITGLNAPAALALSGSHLFVANYGSNTVGKYDANTGTAINANFITGLTQPSALALSRKRLSALAVPTLVQHVATAMECNGVIDFIIRLPNPALSGNCLILGIQYPSTGSISSVTDNTGNNTWTAGPSTTNSTYGCTMAIYYALNVAPRTHAVTIAFNNLSGVSASSPTQAVLSEFYNVATVSASDGSAASPNSPTAGSIVTSASGDLIYHWGASLSTDILYEGGAFNGTSLNAGTDFTLLSADLQVGSCDQYYVQPTAGAIAPSFTPSGSATWGSLAIALKAASAGTAPGPGIRIVHVQHTLVGALTTAGDAAPIPLQFPSTGNLLVGLFNWVAVTSVSDSAGNTWSCPAALLSECQGGFYGQIIYAANATTSPSLQDITLTLGSGSTDGETFQSMLVLFDIAGAATSPYDTGVTTNGQQTANGNLTTGSITPSTSNGLVFATVAVDYQTIIRLVGIGHHSDTVVNTQDDNNPAGGGTPNSSLDEDNGYGHFYNANTSQLTFEWTVNTAHAGGGGYNGVQFWAAVAAAFEGVQP